MPDGDNTNPPPATPEDATKGESSTWWHVLEAIVVCGDFLVRVVAGAVSLAFRVVAWTVGLVVSSCS